MKGKIFWIGLICFICNSTTALAGGSGEEVRILSFQRLNSTDYVLVVAPIETPEEYFIKECESFVVLGTYANLDGQWPLFEKNQVTQDEHLTALSFIEEKSKTDKKLGFGYMGGGFKRVSNDNKCVVYSRALQINYNSIYSYYHKA